jgi:hypothetical protein
MPRSYPRIVFGEAEFSGADITDASLTEEFSPLSITLPINSLEFSLFSDDVAFSIINPTGKYESLLSRQPMAVYEVVDGEQRYLGQYYLDDWSGPSENVKQFSCSDVMGLLDKYTYRGGIWLTPVTMSELVAGILNPIGVEYEIDPDLAAETLTGWLPISSYREALQQVAFAANAYVLAARRDVLVIGKLSQAATITSGVRAGVANTGQSRTYKIRWRQTQSFVYTSGGAVTRGIRSGVPNAGQSRMYKKRWRQSQWDEIKPVVDIPSAQQGSRRLDLRPQVTGVEVTAHDIVQGTGSLELLNQTMPAGVHEIHFSQPMHTLSVSGATIAESGANYALLNVATPGTVILSGLVHVDTTTLYGEYLPPVTGRKENILKITNATLVNSGNGLAICQTIFYYYQQRYVQRMRLFDQSKYTEVGATVNLETLYGNQLLGVIERMTTSLSGGNIADAEVIGIIT